MPITSSIPIINYTTSSDSINPLWTGPLNCWVTTTEVSPIPSEPNLNILDSKVVYSTRYVDHNKQERNYYLSKIFRLYKPTVRRKLVSPKLWGESLILWSNSQGSAKYALRPNVNIPELKNDVLNYWVHKQLRNYNLPNRLYKSSWRKLLCHKLWSESNSLEPNSEGHVG